MRNIFILFTAILLVSCTNFNKIDIPEKSITADSKGELLIIGFSSTQVTDVDIDFSKGEEPWIDVKDIINKSVDTKALLVMPFEIHLAVAPNTTTSKRTAKVTVYARDVKDVVKIVQNPM